MSMSMSMLTCSLSLSLSVWRLAGERKKDLGMGWKGIMSSRFAQSPISYYNHHENGPGRGIVEVEVEYLVVIKGMIITSNKYERLSEHLPGWSRWYDSRFGTTNVA